MREFRFDFTVQKAAIREGDKNNLNSKFSKEHKKKKLLQHKIVQKKENGKLPN
jgi:hypothetical protein